MSRVDALITHLAEYVAEDILASDEVERNWATMSPEQLNKVSIDLAHRYKIDNFYQIAADTFDSLMDDEGLLVLGDALHRYPDLDFDWFTSRGTVGELIGFALAGLMTKLAQKRYLEQAIAKAIRDLVAEQYRQEETVQEAE